MTGPVHPVAPWRRLLADLIVDNSDRDPTTAFAQLATVDCDGNPANRTVTVRGFRPGSDDLLITTDLRSRKISQLKCTSTVALCWYLVAPRQQFRIRGKIAIVNRDAVLPAHQTLWRETWHGLSARTRSQFYRPQPGAPLDSETAHRRAESNGAPPPGNFALLLITPCDVTHLNLRTTPHQRTRHWLDDDGTWRSLQINP